MEWNGLYWPLLYTRETERCFVPNNNYITGCFIKLLALFCHYLAQKSWNWNYEVVEIFPLIWINLLDQNISKNIKPTIVWHTLYCIMKSLTKCFKIIDNADTNTKYLKVHSKYEKYLIISKLEISSLSRFRFEWQDSMSQFIF